MFEVQLKSCAVMKKVLDALKELFDSVIFQCSDKGIQIEAMDKSHISLVSLLLGADGFAKFRCDRNQSMGVNLASMSKILKCANNDDTLEMQAQDNADTVKFIFESPKQPKISHYQMKLMNLDEDCLSTPDIDYACNVRMPSMEFARICRDLSQFGEAMVIECTNGGVSFLVNGDDGDAMVKLTQTDEVDKEEEAVIIENQEPTEMKFSCRYMNMFTKATPLSTQVHISMMDEHPMAVEYNIPKFGYIRFYLASLFDDSQN